MRAKRRAQRFAATVSANIAAGQQRNRELLEAGAASDFSVMHRDLVLIRAKAARHVVRFDLERRRLVLSGATFDDDERASIADGWKVLTVDEASLLTPDERENPDAALARVGQEEEHARARREQYERGGMAQ
jgi:hypothetical protein